MAARNLAVGGATNARVVHADAADFVFPDGDLVVYLYNPFSDAVLSRVLANLCKRGRGHVYIVYKAPRCAASIDASGSFERLDSPSAAPHIAIWQARAASNHRG